MGMDAARRRERDLMRGWRECFRNHGSPMDHATPTNDWLAPHGSHGQGETPAAPSDAGRAARGHARE